MKTNKTIVVSITAITALVLASTAIGHAVARKSSPEDGAVLTESPTEIAIQFAGQAKLVSLTLSAEGQDPIQIDISNAKSMDGRAVVSIEPLEPNTYAVTWRAMGIDGHITAGQFGFVVSASQV